MPEKTDIDATMSAEEASRVFIESGAEAQYGFVEFLANHLSACSRAFEDDLQNGLVLGPVGQAFIASLGRRGDRGDVRCFTHRRYHGYPAPYGQSQAPGGGAGGVPAAAGARLEVLPAVSFILCGIPRGGI